MAKVDNKRWWDFYLIRYLMGTILGAIIFHIVLFKYNSDERILGTGYTKIIEEVLYLNSWYALVFLLAGGMMFSYFASSPILLLHTTRLVLFRNNQKERKINLNVFKIVILFFIAGLTVLISKLLFDIHFGLLFVGLILLMPLFFLLYYWASDTSLNSKNEQNKLKNLTYTLSTKRKKKNSEYLQTYRHLREHGNAFFIVVLEIVLGICLFQAKTSIDVLIILSIWIVPPVIVWFYANYLEQFLLEKNEEKEDFFELEIED